MDSPGPADGQADGQTNRSCALMPHQVVCCRLCLDAPARIVLMSSKVKKELPPKSSST
ncbi:hypothetical protein ACFTAO_32270 [Paenibacillus rhizoplanae]